MLFCANPKAQYLSLKKEIDEAIQKVLQNGQYVLGPEVAAFEKEFSQYLGTEHTIGVGSGTEALHLALAACNVQPGDEVITPAHTAVATVAAIDCVKGIPVFVDIDPKTYTLSPEKVKAAITEKTRVIIPVHLYGQPAEMEEVLNIAHQHKIYIVEDCAQAHGATCLGQKVGAIGDIGCFSFYPTKNLGCIGDGGAAVTKNTQLAEKMRLLREYGWKDKFKSLIKGWNSRLDEIQAAILRIKLKRLDQFNAQRQQLAQKYHQQLNGLDMILPLPRRGTSHVYHLYVVQTPVRDQLKIWLQENGIIAGIHYPQAIHKQPAYKKDAHIYLAHTEKIVPKILTLPLYPELKAEHVNLVCQSIIKFYSS